MKFVQHFLVLLLLVMLVPVASAEIQVNSLISDSSDTNTIPTSSEWFIVAKQNSVIDANQAQPQTVAKLRITSPERVGVYSCDFTSYEIKVLNEGPGRYVQITSNRDWITFGTENQFLEADSQTYILGWVRAPCALEGTKSAKITIEDSNANYYVDQTIDIIRISNLRAAFTNTYASACPTTVLEYHFTITNTGTFDETYAVKTKNYQATIVPSAFYLPRGESKDVIISYLFPVENYGTFEDEVIVTSENNGLELTVPITANVEHCYEYTIAGVDNVSVCEDGLGRTIPFTITNDAAFVNEYSISLSSDAPDFASLSGNHIALAANQTGNFAVVFDPQTEVKLFGGDTSTLGLYNTTIVVESVLGDLVAELPLTLFVDACYETVFDVVEGEYDFCSQDGPFGLTLKNNGIYNETFIISLEGSGDGNITLSPGLLTIPALSEDVVYLNFSNHTDYDVTVTAQIANNSKITAEAEVEFEKQSDSTCYDVKVTPKVWHIWDGNVSDNSTYEKIIEVENIGLRDTDYEIKITSSFVTVDTSSIFLPVSTVANVTLLANPTNITPTKTLTTLHFNTDAATFDKTVKVYYNYQSLWWLWLLLILLVILLLLLLVFALKGGKKKKTRKVKPKGFKQQVAGLIFNQKKSKGLSLWFWILLLLLIILFILLLLFPLAHTNTTNTTITNITAPVDPIEPEVKESALHTCDQADAMLEFIEKNNLTNTFEYQVIPVNGQATFNLKKLFVDPDKDTLNFSSTHAKNITQLTRFSKLYVSADEDFCGVRKIKLFATDPHGEKAESPQITLIFSGKPAFWQKHSTSILFFVGLAIILIIILLVIFAIKKR